MKSSKYATIRRSLVLKYFWRVMRKYPASFFALTSLTIFVGILDVYVPFQYLKLWNVLVPAGTRDVGAAQHIILIILAINTLRWIGRRASSFANDYFQASVIAGLREQAFTHLIGHSNEFFSNNFGGSLVQKINKYANSFKKLMERFIENGLPLFVRGIGTVVAVAVLMPKYAVVLGIFCVVFIITGLIAVRFKLKYDIISSEADTKTTGAIADAITNHSSIQLFTGHTHETKRVGGVINEQRRATLFNWYLWDSLNAVQSFYVLVIEFLLFWIAIGDWKGALVTVPVLILLQGYLNRLADSLWDFSGIVKAFYEAFADAQEMVTIYETPYSVADTSSKQFTKVSGEISFSDVTYVYEKNNTKVLDHFSLHIPKGQKLAVVGSSGAGKSTLVRLLMRLFDVVDGAILIDGIDIRSVTQEALRSKIAFVPQDPVLFHRSLMENIRYGRRDATDEEVHTAAQLAHCDEFIEKLPEKYETYVGERGVKLSGGERQRVAIARAILRNAPILILDEATSALDSHSESLIRDALHTLIQGKTTIVIAHRLSTIREMDRIIVIDSGKISEDGTHDELLKNPAGIYKKLWDLQAGGFKIEEESEEEPIL